MRQFTAAGVAIMAMVPSVVVAAPDVAGNWIVQDKSALITIDRCGRHLCGRIAKALIHKPNYPQTDIHKPNYPQTDIHNPDPKLRKKPLIGLQILSGFVPKADRWDAGLIYDPESGKTYKSVLKLNPDGSLKVSGCVLFFCKSLRWTRAR